MRIPLLRSLSGQLALVMAGALLIASAVNFVLLIGERQRSQLIEQSGPPIARFVDAAQIIFASPPPQGRPLGVGRSQGPGRLQLQAKSAVDNRGLPRDGELERRLTTALIDNGVTISEVRASVRSIVRPERPMGDPRSMFPRSNSGPGFDSGGGPPRGVRMIPDIDPPPDVNAGPPIRTPPMEIMRPPREAREIILSAQLPDGRWLTSFSISPESTSGDMFLLGASTFVIFAFVLAAALWIASRLAQPLRDLTAAAQQIGAAGEPQEVKVRGPGDVRQTLEAFNAMSRRVSQLLGEKDVMLGALGHDLRTPLASLRIRIESMEPEAERLKAARTIEEAGKLLEDILELARQGKSKEPVQAMDASILVEDMVEDYAETGQPVSLASSQKSPVACRPVLLRRALRNLIDNAVIYGGQAEVSIMRIDDEVRIRVSDEGPGMSAEALAGAMDPFYRGDASRNRGTGGAGLGLTLANAIIKAHNGRLVLENRTPSGLDATIILPIAEIRSPR